MFLLQPANIAVLEGLTLAAYLQLQKHRDNVKQSNNSLIWVTQARSESEMTAKD